MKFPDIDPAIHIGPLDIHWYGIMYLVGFALAWFLGVQRAKKPGSGWTPEKVGDLIVAAAVGVIVGGRVGYVLFYGLKEAIADPLWIFKMNQGGMSFHGGLIGVLLAIYWFAWRNNREFWDVTDFIAPLVPLGLFFGRIGNFINGELWGKPTDLPWGIIFPTGGDVPRHPSMLYEAFLEGLVLFAILWWFSARRRPRRAVSGLFLLGYGIFRFAVEFVRIPDVQLGYILFDWMTMGQILSLPMIIIGTWLLADAFQRPVYPDYSDEADESSTTPGEVSESGSTE